MKILVLGVGAIGGYLGLRLLEAGYDVHFLVREARLQALREHGLRIESPLGNVRFTQLPASCNPVEVKGDVIIIACKSWDLDSALVSVRQSLQKGGIVVPLLNGLAHIDRIRDEFGPDRTAIGVTYTSATSTADGLVSHLNHYDRTIIGGLNTEARKRAQPLVDALCSAGVQAESASSIMLDVWEKFVRVTSLAALTCMFRAPVGRIVATDEGARISSALIDECASIAAAAGYPPRVQHLEESRARMTEPGSRLTASAMRDLLSNNRTEGDALVGEMMRRGRHLGVATPLLAVAWTHLQAYELGRQANQAE